MLNHKYIFIQDAENYKNRRDALEDRLLFKFPFNKYLNKAREDLSKETDEEIIKQLSYCSF